MDDDISNEYVTDPEENPTRGGHLPVSGEVGGQIVDHDPLTTDTNDDPEHDPTLAWPGNQAASGLMDEDSSPGAAEQSEAT